MTLKMLDRVKKALVSKEIGRVPINEDRNIIGELEKSISEIKPAYGYEYKLSLAFSTVCVLKDMSELKHAEQEFIKYFLTTFYAEVVDELSKIAFMASLKGDREICNEINKLMNSMFY